MSELLPEFRGIKDLVTERRASTTFEPGLLPDSEKERLCRALLAEFGVTQIETNSRGELIHQCSLPWHDDHDPAASLNYKKLVYNCLSCGSSGGLLWYIGVCRGIGGDEARNWLNEETGTGGVVQDIGSLLRFLEALEQHSGREAVSPIPKMNSAVLDQWAFVHPYLTEVRRMRLQNVLDFRLGYGTLTVRTGTRDDGSPIFVDSERIIVPHFWQDDLVGWQSRRLDPRDGTAKYLNSPDFPKDVTVYNYDPKRRLAYVVESPFNVISKAHLLDGIEGTFGAEVTDAQVRLLSVHRRLRLWMDNDNAGWNATERLGEALAPYCVVEVVNNPWAADAADLTDEVAVDVAQDCIPFSLWKRPKPDDLLKWDPEEVAA